MKCKRRIVCSYSGLRWMALVCLVSILTAMVSACSRASPIPTPSTENLSKSENTQPVVSQPKHPGGLSQPALGQSLAFNHLPPEAGLSQSVVLDIEQDDLGFIWLATQDGLNRFDGTQFKIFKVDPRQPNSLSNSYITTLEKDLSGNLWIGTNAGGLNQYDPSTGLFSHHVHDPHDATSLSENSVTALHVDQDGNLWIGTPNSGVNYLDPQDGRFVHYQNDLNDPNSLSHNAISSIWQSTNGDIWVGTTGGGLNCLERTSGKFKRFTADPDIADSLSSNFVSTVYEDRQGTLWVGTTDGGLNRFAPETASFLHYQYQVNKPSGTNDSWITTIFEDQRDKLWIGTNHGGLNILDRQTGVFTYYTHDPLDPMSLSNDYVITLYEDRSGVLWIGTFGSGVDQYEPFKEKFHHYSYRPGATQGLSVNSIWAIYEDRQENLWIGTMGGGLNRVDLKTGVWTYYLSDPALPTSLNSNNVFSIYQDRAGTYWIGTDVGLSRFDPDTGEFEPQNLSALVLSILEDHLGKFWVASAIGLFLLDRETGEIQTFIHNPDDPNSISSNAVGSLCEDRQGNLWIGTVNGGLNRLDREGGKFVRYQNEPEDTTSLSDDGVISLFPATDDTLWIGTAGGLNHLDPDTGKFHSFREADGLPNDTVYGILEDEQGYLWLSTNRGIARFNPTTFGIKNFDTSDGLQGLEFNQGAYFKNPSGVMYFGGVKGLDVFHPSSVSDNPFIPPIVITDFQIHQKPVEIGAESPLKQPVEVSKEIHLSYTDNTFEFRYAALHYTSPEEQRYQYILEGFDEAWNDVGNVRVARYTRVSPGSYTFIVKGSNSDGIWNETGTAIQLIIPPPFWQTTWFRLLVVAAIAGTFLAIVMLRVHAIEQQRQQLEIQVTERTQELRETMLELEKSKDAAEAANRAKSTFLANISHEFRTPLNAILGFTQVMVWDKSLLPDHKENLEIIHRSSEHLLGLINDVLEISKIEAGRLALNSSNFDLHHMLEGLEEMFRLQAEEKGLALEFALSPDVPRYVRADEGKLRQVMMNLLGNAVKFTEEGCVAIHVRSCDQGGLPPKGSAWVCFEIEDTGPGIAPDEMEQLFTPFVQTSTGKQTSGGTGLGLPISQQYVRLMGGEIQVQSQVGKGSRFKFEIPVESVTSENLEKPRLTRRVIGLESGQPTYRLLVVDDQAANRKLLIKLFTPVGFEVREATNGEEAVNVWEEWSPHLIWMDMRMPVMDGYEATRRIKSTSRGQATVIIALTASGLEEDRTIILSEGCDDYIRKPFREIELFEALARHLGVKYLYEEIRLQGTVEEGKAQPQGERSTELQWTFQDLTARLKQMDVEWLRKLERATVLGEQEILLELVNEIVEIDPHLAAGIANLAEKYNHDRILSLIQKASEGEEHAAH